MTGDVRKNIDSTSSILRHFLLNIVVFCKLFLSPNFAYIKHLNGIFNVQVGTSTKDEKVVENMDWWLEELGRWLKKWL